MTIESTLRLDIKHFKDVLNSDYQSVYLPQSWTRGEEKEPCGSISLWMKSTDYRKYFTLEYTVTSGWSGEKKEYSYDIGTRESECNYGGKRFWFICPNASCRKSCSKLYQRDGYFVCRKCSRLLYYLQKCSKDDRITHYNLSNDKVYELEHNLKKKFYQGKPTKRFKRIQKMKAMAEWGQEQVEWRLIQFVAKYDPNLRKKLNTYRSIFN